MAEKAWNLAFQWLESQGKKVKQNASLHVFKKLMYEIDEDKWPTGPSTGQSVVQPPKDCMKAYEELCTSQGSTSEHAKKRKLA